MSATLLAAPDEESAVRTVAACALDVVPGAELASVSALGRRAVFRSLAATHPDAERLDALQREHDAGPTLEVLAPGGPSLLVADDLDAEPRWEAWPAAASELGARAVVVLRLVSQERMLGALTLYARARHAFDEEALAAARVYAQHAGAAYGTARQLDGLRSALLNRHLIGVSQGILMQRYGLTLEVAFEVLRRHSTQTNTKLHEVAAHVVSTRELPGLG